MSSTKYCKHIISISLGSSERDAKAVVKLGDVEALVERRGTDGDFAKARQLMEQYDGRADAIGLGGTDLYVYAGKQRYTFRESARLIANVRQTPVLDGSGLKNSLERRLIAKLAAEEVVDFRNKKVLLVCGVDRFGMAEALQEEGAQLTFGDLLFALNIDKPIRSLKALAWWAKLLAPVLTKLPVSWLYPMGKEQQVRTPKFPQYFLENDIIAGDFHFIRRFMPESLPEKIIITNTVTAADRKLLKEAGVKLLITTTPCLDGRSFGTNVMEALLVAVKGERKPLAPAEYIALLEQYKIESSVEFLNN
ncbi:MAG: quinate 5-dehydrogenase [Phascolarctobacterium sp.]|nr:quinate 5-dehydrogenase [Phascolarctobacterium sp.]